MVGCMFIDLSGEYMYSEKLSVIRGFEENTYSVDISTNVNESLDELITNQENIEIMMQNLDFCSTLEEDEEYEMLFHHISGQIKNNMLFSDCTDVVMSGDWKEIADYIAKNVFLRGKVIKLGDVLDLEDSTLISLKEAFGDNPNIKVDVQGNDVPISISDYEKTVLAIDEIVNKIKVYNYSPFESLMYAYDLIRDRFYVHEEDTEDYSVSRDLTSVLFGDKIVCVGFANIYNSVARKLGINSMNFFLLGENTGHVRNLMYLKDEKYDINGLYFFDPTFDCKHDNDNNFLMSYKFFCKTKEQMDVLTAKDYYYKSYEYFDVDYLDELDDEMEAGLLDISDIVAFLRKTKINIILRLLELDDVDPSLKGYSKEELMELIEKIFIISDRPIKAQTFIKALYTVRRNQYYENPSKYLFDIDVLTDILVNSRLYLEETAEERLLAALGIRKYLGTEYAKKLVDDFVQSNDLEKDMGNIKLVRTLKTLVDKKSNEDKKIL